ncbi:MAG TPA: class I fructose-bisphosphate aldolase [Acidimicrobiia bacterium]|nr:class I fructose-bisphosphate aldolase [Acidimicrobiia bacterium]
MNADLRATAAAMVAPGKGILAADESVATATKRLNGVGVESTADTRRTYRQLLLTTPSLATMVSGVILFDETLRQSTSDGVPIPALLGDLGVLPGIKVDTGAKPLAGHPGETVTEGLDGLRERIVEYVSLGARFAKWRAVIAVGDGLPTAGCVAANAHALARYAALCQEGGLVPIVEPEVLMDGDHTIGRCEEVTTSVLRAVFAELAAQRVDLEAMVLKPNMVLSAKLCLDRAEPAEVAEATLRSFRQVVPAAVPGVAFLSGGQTPEEATANLDAVNRQAGDAPWALTFSFGRALQDRALDAWRGEADNVDVAQEALFHRTKMNSAAARGAYSADMETVGMATVVL